MSSTIEKIPQLILKLRKRPAIDLNDPRQWRRFLLFSAAGLVVLVFLVIGTYQGVEFMDSAEFCGGLCHQVMAPEYTAYQSSPHARVNCVNCHIGPGADFLVKAKIDGLRQVFQVATNSYERPIPSPVSNLRPSRETCEKCHWPEKFYEDRIRVFQHFDTNETNSETRTTLVFRVGGAVGNTGKGIHWHVTSRIWYLPNDEQRQQIIWVGVEGDNGTLSEYVDPDHASEVTPERLAKEKRLMDCIDCHNRATHVFLSPSQALDNALADGLIDKKLPFIKKKALEAIESSSSQQEAIDKIVAIDDFYRTLYPDIYASSKPAVRQAIDQIKEVYKSTVFPDMSVDSKTHPNNLGHMNSPGCFRCHGRLAQTTNSGGSQTITSTKIRNNCNLCHYSLPADAVNAGT